MIVKWVMRTCKLLDFQKKVSVVIKGAILTSQLEDPTAQTMLYMPTWQHQTTQMGI